VSEQLKLYVFAGVALWLFYFSKLSSVEVRLVSFYVVSLISLVQKTACSRGLGRRNPTNLINFGYLFSLFDTNEFIIFVGKIFSFYLVNK
jgi:hypothetical protein